MCVTLKQPALGRHDICMNRKNIKPREVEKDELCVVYHLTACDEYRSAAARTFQLEPSRVPCVKPDTTPFTSRCSSPPPPTLGVWTFKLTSVTSRHVQFTYDGHVHQHCCLRTTISMKCLYFMGSVEVCSFSSRLLLELFVCYQPSFVCVCVFVFSCSCFLPY